MEEKTTLYCYALIKFMREYGAEKFEQKLEGVTFHGENIGDYKITIEKLKALKGVK